MELRPGPDGGTVAELRAAGWGRFVGAAFLSVWLCGWAAGEAFALFLLGALAWQAAGGRPVVEGQPPGSAGGLAVAAFLLVWLTFWTFGGVAALRQLLELLWGREAVSWGPSGLRVRRRAGPVGTADEVPPGAPVRFDRRRKDGALVAETATGTIVVARLGTRAEREELLGLLRQAFASAPDPGRTDAPGVDPLPAGWREETGLDGVPVLVPAQRWRGVLGALLAAAAALLLVVAGARWNGAAGLGAGAALAVAVGLAAWAGAIAVVTGRSEWALSSGRVELRTRRFGRQTPRFAGDRLRVEARAGQRDEETVSLAAVRGADGTTRPVAFGGRAAMRRLGAFLAGRSGAPLEAGDGPGRPAGPGVTTTPGR